MSHDPPVFDLADGPVPTSTPSGTERWPVLLLRPFRLEVEPVAVDGILHASHAEVPPA